MKSRTEWILVGLASLVVASSTLIPYLAAAGSVPAGRVFSGFLINPVDGYSYLAKMRQGLDGAWGFSLPYTGIPAGSAVIFLFYLSLGHLSGALHLPLLAVYHGSRVLFGFLMYLSVYGFLKTALRQRLPRLAAFAFVLIGSGVGWLGLVAGLQGSDLLVPESIPFVTAFTNPHFPAALALVAWAALWMIGDGPWVRRAVGGALAGTGLGIVLPFAVAPVILAGGAWSVWEGLRQRKSPGVDLLRQPGWVATLGVGLGAAPWLAYDARVVSTHPALASWNAQNLTPSPPAWDYLLGFGVVLVWAAYALLRSDAIDDRRGRFLVAWAVVNGVLLYAPFSLQRRFSLGLFIPLAGLAGIGAARMVHRSAGRGWLLFVLSLCIVIPSNALVVGAGLSTAAAGSPLVTETVGEASGYAWLQAHAAPGQVVLASPDTGVRLPAYAPVTVVAGHPFETPEVDARRKQLEAMFDGSLDTGAAESRLADWNVAFVFFGPREQAIGEAQPWMTGLDRVFDDEGVTIYNRRTP